jgi:hypothetical protein
VAWNQAIPEGLIPFHAPDNRLPQRMPESWMIARATPRALPRRSAGCDAYLL